METLSTRAERLTIKSQVKRLFYLCALLGLVSLVGVCVVILPWHILITQGQWVAFVFLAIVGFCWMASVAAMGQLELDLPQTVKNVSGMLTVVMLAQIALGLFLEYEFVTKKSQHIENCLSLDPTNTSAFCKQRIESIIIAFPFVVFLLPVLSIPLLYLLFRQTSILSISHLYSNLDNPSSSDLPPNWNVQPKSYAPDSSASDDSDDDEGKSLRGGRRMPSATRNKNAANDGAGDAWFELGKREKGPRRWRAGDRKIQGGGAL
ncbi:hypothetical protein JCM3765_001867 [Sporobolomyces pararoseus]